MVLLVRAKVLPSRIHGRGLFAGEDIPKGAVVWRFDPRVDKVVASAAAEVVAVAEASAAQANAVAGGARAAQTIPSSVVNEACRSGLEGRLARLANAHMI